MSAQEGKASNARYRSAGRFLRSRVHRADSRVRVDVSQQGASGDGSRGRKKIKRKTTRREVFFERREIERLYPIYPVVAAAKRTHAGLRPARSRSRGACISRRPAQPGKPRGVRGRGVHARGETREGAGKRRRVCAAGEGGRERASGTDKLKEIWHGLVFFIAFCFGSFSLHGGADGRTRQDMTEMNLLRDKKIVKLTCYGMT